MTVETATYINQLDATKPSATDLKSEGDDHLRLIKSSLQATFPNVTGAVTPTHTELNYVAGVTSALQTQLNAKAPLASPALTGTPTAPTAAAGTNTTQVATTAHVFAERSNTATLTNKTFDLANNTFAATSAQLAASITDETGTGALLFANSPAMTGTPTAPTASVGTSSTQVATTAFVAATAFSAALPSQTGNAGKYVTTDGTNASWAAVATFNEYTSSGTWTKPSNATFVMVEVWGGGGGGGSGGVGARTGGSAGGGGAYAYRLFKASDLGSTETVTIGAGGAGGVAVSANDGNSGTTGGNSNFGTKLYAYGGGAGQPGTTVSRSATFGGGVLGSNTPFNVGDGTSTQSGHFAGGSPASNPQNNLGSPSGFGGGGGGGALLADIGLAGGCSYQGGAGGGGGGGAASNGGAGGSITGETGGGGSAGTGNGGAGGAGTTFRFGGGGGAAGTGGTSGGAGGAGGIAAGGGGGGSAASGTSGAGGSGGSGLVRVYSW